MSNLKHPITVCQDGRDFYLHHAGDFIIAITCPTSVVAVVALNFAAAVRCREWFEAFMVQQGQAFEWEKM